MCNHDERLERSMKIIDNNFSSSTTDTSQCWFFHTPPNPCPTDSTFLNWALMGPKISSTRSKKTKICGICNKVCDTQGFVLHERACRKKHGTEGSRRALAELLSKEKELGEFTS